MKHIMKKLKILFPQPYLDIWFDSKLCLDVLMNKPGATPGRIWLFSMVGLIVTWMVYVPVHELMHVAGCLISGGSVSELRLDPMYGAAFLNNFFPFVVPAVGNEYAGRLTGFDTYNSDFIYLMTVFFPFLLTIVAGGLMLRLSWKKKNSFLFGSSLVVAGAPFISLTGDYLEMGSIMGTNLLSAWDNTNLFRFRSDDLFRLFLEMYQEPAVFGLTSLSGSLMAVFIVFISLSIGILLAGWTYAISRKIADFFMGAIEPEEM